MEFEEAQQYRDEYIQGKRDAGLQVSDRNGFYISSSIKDQGKTGNLYALCHQHAVNSTSIKGYSLFVLSARCVSWHAQELVLVE